MISVIIPTLNEQDNLPTLLKKLYGHSGIDFEVIVVDGGSDDDTLNVAASYPVICCKSRRGRGHQLSEGLKKARGDIIFFLHADSQITSGSLNAIKRNMDTDHKLIGGNFKLLFDGDDDFSQWLNGFYRSLRLRGIYYGDSGVFIRKQVLDKIGGLRATALMEDYDLVRRMERSGLTTNIKEPVMITSSRRFLGRKKWSIIWGWIKIHLLYYLGCSGDYLADLYDSKRSSQHQETNS